jgi:hypothetical protein
MVGDLDAKFVVSVEAEVEVGEEEGIKRRWRPNFFFFLNVSMKNIETARQTDSEPKNHLSLPNLSLMALIASWYLCSMRSTVCSVILTPKKVLAGMRDVRPK